MDSTALNHSPDNVDVMNWLRLVLTPEVGAGAIRRLLQAFETPENMFQAPQSALEKVPRLSREAIHNLLQTARGCLDKALDQELKVIEKQNLEIIFPEDPQFPPLLREIEDPPVFLFMKGRIIEADYTPLAVVGTRSCDSYSLRMTREIVGELASKGLTIVSGLAHGIDGAAHRAALSVSGRTIAFLPCGFSTIYPPEHFDLMNEIATQGAVLSEYPSQTKPIPRCFHSRNRLVSGSSLGVFVVQAPIDSGAMITARFALEQNREVFALPGRVDERGSEGPHRLIQDGARLVHSAQDILNELRFRLGITSQAVPETSPQPSEKKTPRARKPSPKPDRELARPAPSALNPPGESAESTLQDPLDILLYKRLKAGRVHIDRLAADLGHPVGKISERLLLLEMKGIVKRLPGMYFDLA
ncbi:MAG: DNA-protecting protein DprA [Candidatus Omnitrophica bacterium COP1]|nr:DNA-protecting protein DprA [Candidatus Omnitrophica bacterium COP1]